MKTKMTKNNKTREIQKKGQQLYQFVRPSKLKAHHLNEKFFGLNDSNYDRLKASIVEKGFLPDYPIRCVQEKSGLVIICGHRRWRIAIELGITEIPVFIITTNLNENELIAILIESNLSRSSEMRDLPPFQRYLLALPLFEIFPEQRGGDRQSNNFTVGQNRSKHKIKWFAAKAQICEKYATVLNTVTDRIIEEVCKVHPDLIAVCETKHDKLLIILKNRLNQDLTDLFSDKAVIAQVHEKYKTRKKANQHKFIESLSADETSQIPLGPNRMLSPVTIPASSSGLQNGIDITDPRLRLISALEAYLISILKNQIEILELKKKLSAEVVPQYPIEFIQFLLKTIKKFSKGKGCLGMSLPQCTENDKAKNLSLFDFISPERPQ